ncbi:hypothetical protein EVJ58_g2484 [Rhodofomes roseus]|uniref:2'-phosphotransferase n=1 Tax=Rhodofomes roseus TaxID=34475 RepID=A0A4Y9YQ08_9APHY|nr:hypothetical protein EVJ58_g2484 [Rhodofomes roseus]
MSKTLSWVLRHGSQAEGLAMRPDGYVRVDDLVCAAIPLGRAAISVTLKNIVQNDSKSRYDLKCERDESLEPPKEIWWIRANQGHSMKEVKLDLKLMNSVKDIPTGIAVHGTTRMRNSSQILIYVDVQKALEAGIKFFLSANGVVLTEGDEKGFLGPQFFARVETAKGEALPGWETTQAVPRIKEVKKAEAAEKDKPTEVDATVAGSVTDT